MSSGLDRSVTRALLATEAGNHTQERMVPTPVFASRTHTTTGEACLAMHRSDQGITYSCGSSSASSTFDSSAEGLFTVRSLYLCAIGPADIISLDGETPITIGLQSQEALLGEWTTVAYPELGQPHESHGIVTLYHKQHFQAHLSRPCQRNVTLSHSSPSNASKPRVGE